MGIPKSKWLNWYSCIVIVIAAVETGVLVQGSFFDKVILSIVSCMTIFLGLFSSSFVIGGHFKFANKNQSITGSKYIQLIRDITVFAFWAGIVLSGITLFTYPVTTIDNFPFSIVPFYIGLSIGARRMHSKYC